MTKPLNKYIDHTLLKPDATKSDIASLCREALEYDFFSVCINGCHVPLAKTLLSGSNIKIASVAGFPLGAMPAEAKRTDALQALSVGANEIDAVINIGALKDERYSYVLQEISMLSQLCHAHGALLKLIIETCLLTKHEIITACHLAAEGHADFVKTSTGFSTGGASVEDIVLMKSSVGNNMKIKASGGIRTYDFAKALIDAGADRLGCSASVSIWNESLL